MIRHRFLIGWVDGRSVARELMRADEQCNHGQSKKEQGLGARGRATGWLGSPLMLLRQPLARPSYSTRVQYVGGWGAP